MRGPIRYSGDEKSKRCAIYQAFDLTPFWNYSHVMGESLGRFLVGLQTRPVMPASLDSRV